MAANDPITALEYNNIRDNIKGIVGNVAAAGSPTGYGRSFSSTAVVGGSTVGVSDKVTQSQMLNLFLDLQAGHVHQYGFVNGSIVPADFTAQTDLIDFQDITDFNTISNAISSFNHASTDFPSANFSTDLLRTPGGSSCSSVRSSAWGGTSQVQTITHSIIVDFGNHNNFRYFLNSGGEIRFNASLTGGTSGTANTKDWDWAQILSAMGTIRFGRVAATNWRTESISPGTGSGSLLSSIASGSASTLIFTKQGGVTTGAPSPGDPSGTSIYDDNEYRIYAGTNSAIGSATQLLFRVEFADLDAGTGGQVEGFPDPVDEPVTGTVTSNVYTYTADSDFVVDAVTYPAIQLTPPTGSITSNL